eukprot:c29114_g1_i1 orf=1056-1868(-)
MTKADSPKPPTKLETITLKVFIHCEGCRRKVRRIIRILDGVEDVTVDSATGKVTVTGTADVKTILQRLQKYGKHAEMWPSSNPAPAAAPKAGGNQPKPNNTNDSDNNSKKKSNPGGDSGGKAAAAAGNETKKGGGKKEEAAPDAVKGEDGAGKDKISEKSKEANSAEVSKENTPTQNGGGGGGGGGGGKKGGKKGGNGNNTSNGGSNAAELPSVPIHDLPVISAPDTSIAVSANKSLAPYDSIQTGYTLHTAEYATHMFSDENANNCSIM